MRLTPQEITKLIQAIQEFLGQNPAELRLFGSRTDDKRKGGDIDLLLVVDNAEFNNQLNLQKHLVLARMKELIGDQKIDLRITHPAEIKSDPFLQLIYPQSVSLHSWTS